MNHATSTAPSNMDISSQDGFKASSDNQRPVRLWLYVMAVLVAAMVFVGGATRLTDSGLSITEWKPITGAIPPLSQADWYQEFEKYKQIPEYHYVNKGMSLAQFKTIYWWEWGHRFLGRFMGVAFLLPFLCFAFMGRIGRSDYPKMALLFLLGGLQGAIGWWMVASGLINRVDVSQYRLAIHLSIAFLIFAAIIWVARSMAPPLRDTTLQNSLLFTGQYGDVGIQAKACKYASFLIFLIFLQVFLGGLVAGIDAGLTYTTWPLMNGAFIPTWADLTIMTPFLENFGENPLTVQFMHRSLAYSLLIFAWWYVLRLRASAIGDRLVAGALVLALALTIQALIGIATLVLHVPLKLALLHQAGALIALTIAVIHRHDFSRLAEALRYPSL